MALSTVLKLHPSCQCNLSMLLGKFESKCQLIHWEKFISISYSIASEATSYCKRTWNAEKDEELTSCCPVPSSYYYPITQSKVIKLFGLRTHGKGSRRGHLYSDLLISSQTFCNRTLVPFVSWLVLRTLLGNRFASTNTQPCALPGTESRSDSDRRWRLGNRKMCA